MNKDETYTLTRQELIQMLINQIKVCSHVQLGNVFNVLNKYDLLSWNTYNDSFKIVPKGHPVQREIVNAQQKEG